MFFVIVVIFVIVYVVIVLEYLFKINKLVLVFIGVGLLWIIYVLFLSDMYLFIE